MTPYHQDKRENRFLTFDNKYSSLMAGRIFYVLGARHGYPGDLTRRRLRAKTAHAFLVGIRHDMLHRLDGYEGHETPVIDPLLKRRLPLSPY